MRCIGHVRGEGGRGDACAGGEHASGGLGREAPEWEGEFGNYAKGHGKWEEKEGKERGREREIRRVSGDEERKKRENAEERESVGLGVHCCWGYYFRYILVVCFVQIMEAKLTVTVTLVLQLILDTMILDTY